MAATNSLNLKLMKFRLRAKTTTTLRSLKNLILHKKKYCLQNNQLRYDIVSLILGAIKQKIRLADVQNKIEANYQNSSSLERVHSQAAGCCDKAN